MPAAIVEIRKIYTILGKKEVVQALSAVTEAAEGAGGDRWGSREVGERTHTVLCSVRMRGRKCGRQVFFFLDVL